MDIRVRNAEPNDLAALTEIYNYYVVNTPVTFDLEPYSVEARKPWFEQFATHGRHRLLVAEMGGTIVGYAGTMRFRKPLGTPRAWGEIRDVRTAWRG